MLKMEDLFNGISAESEQKIMNNKTSAEERTDRMIKNESRKDLIDEVGKKGIFTPQNPRTLGEVESRHNGNALLEDLLTPPLLNDKKISKSTTKYHNEHGLEEDNAIDVEKILTLEEDVLRF